MSERRFAATALVVGMLLEAILPGAATAENRRPDSTRLASGAATVGVARVKVHEKLRGDHHAGTERRECLTDEQAFTLLVSTSQKSNIKIHELATWLVDETNNAARRPK